MVRQYEIRNQLTIETIKKNYFLTKCFCFLFKTYKQRQVLDFEIQSVFFLLQPTLTSRSWSHEKIYELSRDINSPFLFHLYSRLPIHRPLLAKFLGHCS